MPDRETVITHLQIIHTWAEFARERDLQFFTQKHLDDIAKWTDDALELLKEQEETINALAETIRQLNQHIKDLSEYMTPHGKVKDIKACIELLKEQEEREKAICKEICDFIRGSCSTDTYSDKEYVCNVVQQMFIKGRPVK